MAEADLQLSAQGAPTGTSTEKHAYLGYLGVLEPLFHGHGVPVNVCLVPGMLDNCKEEHGFRGGGFLLLGGCLGHDELENVSFGEEIMSWHGRQTLSASAKGKWLAVDGVDGRKVLGGKQWF